MEVLSSATGRYTGLVAVAAVFLWSLYRYLLPKPIQGIPYNVSATASLLGDIPAMEKEGKDNAFAWMTEQARKFRSPICQLFIFPFGKPAIFLLDYHEAQDIMMRRKEFDRSDYSIALLGGLAENHHINLKTGPEWKAHRRLLQDLMTPKFLNNVAGRNIYSSATRLIDLWESKTRIAAGRPFAADKDIYFTALDAVLDFTFGDSYPHRALPPQIEAVQNKTGQTNSLEAGDDAIEFAVSPIDKIMTAFLQASESIGYVSNLGLVTLAWWWKKMQREEKECRATRRTFLEDQVSKATAKLQKVANTDDEEWVSSATDLMMQRERGFAQKEGREPVYWSEAMHDEILGFVIAGHDTTSTTLSWAVKLMADNQASQNLLRQSLQSAHSAAHAEKRAPTYEEIIKTSIPYLDAVIEEILRLAHTLPLMERQCSEDTVVLGHHIPKGTTVFMPGFGPSLTEPGFPIDDTLRNESSRTAIAEKGRRTWREDSMNDFQPERWLTDDDEKRSYNGTAGPILAFGLGTRGCYGRKLAYLEMKLVLTLIIWNFELQQCPEALSSYEDVQGLTRTPKYCYIKPQKVLG